MMAIRLILYTMLLLLAGCGGVTGDQEQPTGNDRFFQEASTQKIPVRILRVTNKTGKVKYDDLCHYIHIKTAQVLTESGKYEVLSDEILAHRPEIVTERIVRPEMTLEIEISDVMEYNGGTFRMAIFSTQRKQAKVDLKIIKTTSSNHRTTQHVSGSSTKGVWGVIASVDRDSMIRGKGFWNVDHSMVGIAASRALQHLN